MTTTFIKSLYTGLLAGAMLLCLAVPTFASSQERAFDTIEEAEEAIEELEEMLEDADEDADNNYREAEDYLGDAKATLDIAESELSRNDFDDAEEFAEEATGLAHTGIRLLEETNEILVDLVTDLENQLNPSPQQSIEDLIAQIEKLQGGVSNAKRDLTEEAIEAAEDVVEEAQAAYRSYYIDDNIMDTAVSFLNKAVWELNQANEYFEVREYDDAIDAAKKAAVAAEEAAEAFEDAHDSYKKRQLSTAPSSKLDDIISGKVDPDDIEDLEAIREELTVMIRLLLTMLLMNGFNLEV